MALRGLADRMKSDAISVDFTSAGNVEDLPDLVNKTLYAVAQGALRNVMEHADASRASMHLEANRWRVRLTISDNGKGFDSDRLNRDPTFGMGLRSMDARLKEVRGNLRIPGSSSGTTVIAIIPLSFFTFIKFLFKDYDT